MLWLQTVAVAQTTAPSASQVTPRSLAPETAAQPKPRIVLPRESVVPVPEGADNLLVTLGDILLEGGFPERAAADAAILRLGEQGEIPVGDVYRIAGAIQSAYADAGFPFVRVTVPPQDLRSGGTARLVLVDGVIDSLVLDAVHPALRRSARAFLGPLVGKRRVRISELDRQISLLSDTPGATVRTAVAPGDTAGGVKLIVEAELDRMSGSLAFDNRSSDAFRNRQITASLAANGIFGAGDTIYVYASGDPLTSPPIGRDVPRKVLGGGLAFPVGADGLVAGLEYTKSRTIPIGSPIVTRDEYEKVSTSLSYPLIRSRLQTLGIRGSIERYSERNVAPEFDFMLFRDAYVIGRLRVDYSRNGDIAAVGGGLGLSYGATKPTEDRSKVTATRTFTKLEGSAFVSARLPVAGLVAGASALGQLILDGGIPLGESFGLDGASGLSSFSAGGASADRGGVIRLTLSRPTPFADNRVVATPLLFAAGGLAGYQAGDPFLLRKAGVAGVGLQLAAARPLNGLSPTLSIEYGARFADRSYARGDRLNVDLRIGF